MLIHGTRIMAAQREVGEKTNEIPEAPRLLQNQNLEGVVVTADAMHTQTEFAKFLVDEKKADYVLVVKENQPRLKEEIAEWFEAGSFPPSGGNDGAGPRTDRIAPDRDDHGVERPPRVSACGPGRAHREGDHEQEIRQDDDGGRLHRDEPLPGESEP